MASDAVGEFLRHLRARDLPDSELFALKARAFDEMAEVEREPVYAETMRAVADESRRLGGQGDTPVPTGIEAIKKRRDWRAGKDLSPVEVRLDDEHLAKHYAEDVTFLIGIIERAVGPERGLPFCPACGEEFWTDEGSLYCPCEGGGQETVTEESDG